jgi:hypothetical protein
VSALANCVFITEEVVISPDDEVRGSGRDVIRASRTHIRFDGSGCSNRLHDPLATHLHFGASARPQQMIKRFWFVQLHRLTMLRGATGGTFFGHR